MSEIVFALDAVGRHFTSGEGNRLDVLDGANLALKKGELVALVGPSGSGKTTLLQIAGLLEKPDSGDVLINGKACGNLADKARTDARLETLGFVYQFHHLLPDFSALENVMMPQRIAGKSVAVAKKRAIMLLEKVGLGARLQHRPAQLSGGEQQRTAIARALANDPAVLLADEPTGNLDPDNAGDVFAMLMELAREEGLSALIATHNPELAKSLDRVVTLDHGTLVSA